MSPRNIITLLTVASALAGCTEQELAAVDNLEAAWKGEPTPSQLAYEAAQAPIAVAAVEEPEPAEMLVVVEEIAEMEPEPEPEPPCVPVFRVVECE